jgi:hypothetical protein
MITAVSPSSKHIPTRTLLTFTFLSTSPNHPSPTRTSSSSL